MEGFLGFLSVILAFMYWGKRGDYEDLRSKVGSIDAYKITTQIDIERHRKWNMEMLKEKEKTVDQKQKFLQQFLNAKIADFPVVATVIADYETAKDEHIAHMLETKNVARSKHQMKYVLFAQKNAHSYRKTKPISGNSNI